MSDNRITDWLERDPLARISVQVIREGQTASGAYIASPTFSQYGYGWLRDGSFCALAMEAVGENESAERFHAWVASTVLRHRSMFHHSMIELRQGRIPPAASLPPTRYRLDGTLEPEHGEAWPNFQLDGYGTWLCALAAKQGSLSEDMTAAMEIVADLLSAAWDKPCFDCWEEAGDRVHGSTLLAVSGGLSAAGRTLGEVSFSLVALEVRKRMEQHFVRDGVMRKFADDDRVDASLAWAAVPHGAYEADEALVLRTVDRIVDELGAPGIRRYIGDSYFGGGDWVLLTGLVAWQDAVSGNRARWEAGMRWMRSTVTAEGWLPEQTLARVQFPEFVEQWERRWGSVATPLLWSHAMYLLAGTQGALNAWNF